MCCSMGQRSATQHMDRLTELLLTQSVGYDNLQLVLRASASSGKGYQDSRVRQIGGCIAAAAYTKERFPRLIQAQDSKSVRSGTALSSDRSTRFWSRVQILNSNCICKLKQVHTTPLQLDLNPFPARLLGACLIGTPRRSSQPVCLLCSAFLSDEPLLHCFTCGHAFAVCCTRLLRLYHAVTLRESLLTSAGLYAGICIPPVLMTWLQC